MRKKSGIYAYTIILSLVVIIAFISTSCTKNSAENDALLVIKTYVTALKEYDAEKQAKCMDPSVNSFQKGAINSIGNLFGLSDMYDMANGAAGIVGAAAEEISGYDIDLKYIDLLSSEIPDNTGHLTVKYEIELINKETKDTNKQYVSWTFYVIRKDSKWYIQRYDTPQVIDSNENSDNKDAVNVVGGKISGFDFGYSFSGGRAIVRVPDIGNRLACIDKNGIIQFFLPEGYNVIQSKYSFINGVMLLYGSVGNYKLISDTGKILYNFEGENKSFDVTFTDMGYCIVEEKEESYAGTTTKDGLLNSNGEWEIPLRENTYLSSVENGIIHITSENGSVQSSYDCKTKAYSEGFIDVLYEGLKYKSGSGLTDYNMTPGFYDENDNLVIDLSEYQVSGSPIFVDGVACFGSNGFTVIIDKSGNRLCEPVKGEPTDLCYENMKTSKCISIYNEGNLYYDFSGKLLFSVDGYVDRVFSEGLIEIGDNGLHQYVDVNGNVVIG